MDTLSLDAILQRARALCLEAGLDPDRPAQDGRPEWLGFISEARSSLRKDQQTQDPLKSLESTYAGEQVREQETARLERSHETADPLAKLERLYREEMHEGFERTNLPAQRAEVGSVIEDFTPDFEAATTLGAVGEAADPLETLRTLEAATRDLQGNSKDDTKPALRDPDRLRGLKKTEDY